MIIQNLSWKLSFVKPEEREYVSQEILIIMKNYCWLFLWITLGMSRFRRDYARLNKNFAKSRTMQIRTKQGPTVYLASFQF